jgi:ABC-type transport system involved in multi-copper enzyme maturation permease subunit
MSPALFGILQLDRGEPWGYGNLAGLVQAWLQDAGGFAAVGLLVYLLYALTTPTDKSLSEKLRVPISTWMVLMGALAVVVYAGVLALVVLDAPGRSIAGFAISPPPLPEPAPGSPVITPPPAWHWELRPMLLMVGGLFALLGIGEPFVRDAVKLRFRRIWALTKLGYKEAVRFRLQWVFLIILLPFLFQSVWVIGRPADEFRKVVGTATLFLTVLTLFTAVLLASFSIPNDVKNLTIHTVVTKPVERFEVVMGRFFGYTALMTLALAGMTAVCLLFMNTSKFDPKAEEETAKARVPVRGKLSFQSRKLDFEGTNVGREFEYRKYIHGHPDSPQRAIWKFYDVPVDLTKAEGDAVPVEFTFDIFRLVKMESGKNVLVTVRVCSYKCPQKPPAPHETNTGEWTWGNPEQFKEYRAEADAARAANKNPDTARPGTEAWKEANRLAEKYGYYELRNREIQNHAVIGVHLPAGVFRNAREGDPVMEKGKDGKEERAPRVRLYVKCESPGQLLGMAEPDLYVLESTQTFSQNFVKGAIGLWCRLCIVIGVAVACSTYLSGVLSLLMTALIYLLGNQELYDHLNDLAYGRVVGGGPFEATSRMLKAESPTTPLTEGAGTAVIQRLDQFWAWVFRRVQNVIPDVEQFTWTNFVSEGFNVSGEYLVINLLVMIGYLLPWFVLAYYLMKTREIAS